MYELAGATIIGIILGYAMGVFSSRFHIFSTKIALKNLEYMLQLYRQQPSKPNETSLYTSPQVPDYNYTEDIEYPTNSDEYEAMVERAKQEPTLEELAQQRARAET